MSSPLPPGAPEPVPGRRPYTFNETAALIGPLTSFDPSEVHEYLVLATDGVNLNFITSHSLTRSQAISLMCQAIARMADTLEQGLPPKPAP